MTRTERLVDLVEQSAAQRLIAADGASRWRAGARYRHGERHHSRRLRHELRLR